MATIKLQTEMNQDAANTLFAWATAVADIIVVDGDRKVRLGDLTSGGVHYLADYGMAKSLSDAVSGVKAAIKDADDKALAKFAKECGLDGSTDRDAITTATINAKQGKRFESIVASSLPVRDGTGKRSAEAVWIDTMAESEMRAKHEKAGRDMPKGQALRELRAKYVAAHAERFAKLWADHVAALAAGAGIADEVLGF